MYLHHAYSNCTINLVAARPDHGCDAQQLAIPSHAAQMPISPYHLPGKAHASRALDFYHRCSIASTLLSLPLCRQQHPWYSQLPHVTCSCFAALQACSWQALDKSTTPQFIHDISTFTYISTGYLCITGTDNASVMLYEASGLTEGEHGHLRFFKFLQRDRAFTALHLAVCHQRIEQVTMLLGQLGISTSARTQQHGLTPLHIAALTGNAQIAETLLRSCSRGGAPPHALHAALHARDKLTLAPLDHAAAWAQAGTAELLLAWGAPVNQLSWSTENPPDLGSRQPPCRQSCAHCPAPPARSMPVPCQQWPPYSTALHQPARQRARHELAVAGSRAAATACRAHGLVPPEGRDGAHCSRACRHRASE